MHLSIDIIILVVVAVFAGKGFYKGFFNEFLTLLGFVLAFVAASKFYGILGDKIQVFLKVSPGLGKFAAYLLIFLPIVFLFAMLGNLLSQGAKKLKVSGTNRLLGGAFGAAKGTMLVGIVVVFILKQGRDIHPGLAASVKGSTLAPYVGEFFNKAMDLIHF